MAAYIQLPGIHFCLGAVVELGEDLTSEEGSSSLVSDSLAADLVPAVMSDWDLAPLWIPTGDTTVLRARTPSRPSIPSDIRLLLCSDIAVWPTNTIPSLKSILAACSLGAALGSAQTTTMTTSTDTTQATTASSSSSGASASASSLADVQRTLITGNHILDQNGVVDAYGHLSVRHPTDAGLFLLSRQVAPALVAAPADLVVYRVSDGEAVDPNAPRGFIERYIHSELYKTRPNVTSVLHSHAEAVLPFTVAPEVPFRALVHMAGFVGADPVPVWDIADAYQPGDPQDLLVRNTRLGASLAAAFEGDRRLVLMRGHGFTTVSETGIEEAVFRGFYTANNARVEAGALDIQEAYSGVPAGGASGNDSVVFLSPDEARDTEEYIRPTINKPWDLWVRKVEVDPLYVNEA